MLSDKGMAKTYDLEAMKAQWRELTYRIAMTEALIKDTEQLEAAVDQQQARGELKEMEAHLDKAEPEALLRIRQSLHKEKRRRFAFTTLPRLAHSLPLILLILALTAGVAVATVSPLRVKVSQLLIRLETQYAQLRLSENEGLSYEVPGDWEGYYFPSYIPEEFEPSKAVPGLNLHIIRFSAQGNKTTYFHFRECYGAYYSNVDIENGIARTEMIKDSPALIVEEGEKVSVTWRDGLAYLQVESEGLTAEETYKIALSVQRIKK